MLAETETFYPERATLEEARAALEAHLEELAAAGQAAVTEAGRSEPGDRPPGAVLVPHQGV